jgi:N-acetylmuramate 1-kinase
MMILGSDIIAFTRDALELPEPMALEVAALSGRGSDRKYYRLRWGGGDSAILVDYDPRRTENAYFADIAVFLNDIHVPAPRLICHSPVTHLIVMEDLGNADLWSLRMEHWETRRSLYRQTLTIINRVHSFPCEEFAAKGVRLMEPFGPDLYRWEREYFLEHFVEDLCGINLPSIPGEELDQELSRLAGRLSASPPRLVHRDLQSQNVMIHHDKPVLIDFQGMRFGNPVYDLASLLCDPYVDFSDAEVEELLAYYWGLTERDLGWPAFQDRFREASAQRLMQALGAYAFLGLKKGLPTYLSHIPAGLHNLTNAAKRARSLPHLRGLCEICRTALADRALSA